MATTGTVAAEEAVEEYESDPEEVKRSLVMRRREASDDEEEELEERGREKRNARGMDRRGHIHSYDESDGQGGAPADYDDEEEEDEELEVEEEEEEEVVYEEEEEIFEEEDGKEEARSDGEVKSKGMEGGDGGRRTEGSVDARLWDNDKEKNDGVEGTEEEGKKESNEPFAVPTAGAFYMHDDRFRDNVGGRHRRTHGGRKLWESKDDRKWGHDKFEEMTLQERHYEEGRRSSRGRYRARGKNRGPDHGYARGDRSKAFNNNNSHQNQATKGVRGRGPRRYEHTWKNRNQAPPTQNKQSGKSLENSSHTNSGRAFTPASNAEPDPVSARKQVFASSLSSASPPFYPSSSSNKDINNEKRDVQSGNTSRNLRTSGIDESFSVEPNAMQRGKNIVDFNMDKLYIDESNASASGKPLNNLQMLPSSQPRSQGRGVAIPQQIAYQPAPPHNQVKKVSPPTQIHTGQRSSSQTRVQPSVLSPTQYLGQRSASGSQASSPPKTAASAINSNDSGEVESPSESSKSKGAFVGKGKGSQGRGSFPYGGAQIMGTTGGMTVAHGDQNFPAFLPVMQFGGQHPGGIGVPAVGMAFPGYVAQPQLGGLGNSEMTWLPVLAGAAGALGATYCPPYIAVDGAYNSRPLGQASTTGSSSKEVNTNKPNSEWKPSQRSDPSNDEFGQQHNKPQPRRYSAMNLANDVLR